MLEATNEDGCTDTHIRLTTEVCKRLWVSKMSHKNSATHFLKQSKIKNQTFLPWTRIGYSELKSHCRKAGLGAPIPRAIHSIGGDYHIIEICVWRPIWKNGTKRNFSSPYGSFSISLSSSSFIPSCLCLRHLPEVCTGMNVHYSFCSLFAQSVH